MSWDAAFADQLNRDMQAGGARQPSTLSDVVSAEWDAAGLSTSTGISKPYSDAVDDLAERVSNLSGRPIDDLAAERRGPRLSTLAPRARGAIVSEIARGLGPDHLESLKPYLDLDARAREKAVAIEAASKDVSDRTYGLSGPALGFAAAAARQTIDPLNLAATVITAPLGGTGGMGIAAFLGREAAVNAAVQAAQEPYIQAGRAQLGLQSGLGDAIENVALAGVGGAGLAGLLRGAGVALNRVRTSIGAELSTSVRTEPGPLRDLAAEDFSAAAQLVERDQVLDLSSHDPTPAGRIASTAATDKVAEQLELGRVEAVDMMTPLSRHRVSTADGISVEVQPLVMEARDLLTSADGGYDAALQPRDRSRAASQAQIREIAGSLDPERLGYSAEADRGAPIVGADRMVESGNGRVLAIRAAYEDGGAAASRYREWLARQGVDVTGFDQPILVRQRVSEATPEERRAFTVSANRAATLALSAPERAMADAGLITPDMLALLRNTNDLAALGNRDFVRALVGRLPQAEQGVIATADGGLSSEGLRRVRNAILARAYDDPRLMTRIAEATSDEVKSISNSLVRVAPEWAKLRADVQAGLVPDEVDLTKSLVEAVERTADLRARGQSLEAFLAQRDAFDVLDPQVEGWMRLFYNESGRRAAGQETIARGLLGYVEEARKIRAEPGLDLGLPSVRPEDLQRLALAKAADEPITADLFKPTPAPKADAGSIIAERLGPAELLARWKAEAPHADLAALYRDAAARQEQLGIVGREIAAETGAEFKLPGFKEEATSAEKLSRKGYADARELTDVNRAGFVTTTPAQADAIVAGLARRFEVLDEGWRTNEVGYFDRKVLVRFDDGTIGEIQLWEPTTLEVKKAGGHALYTEARQLAADDPRLPDLIERQKALYSAASASLGDDWRSVLNASSGNAGGSPTLSAISSAENRLPSSATTAELTRSQPLSEPKNTQASPGDQAYGRSSQSPMEISGRSIPEDISPQGLTGNKEDLLRTARRADVERALEAAGGDMEVVIVNRDGSEGRVSARQLLEQTRRNGDAAAELEACILRGGA